VLWRCWLGIRPVESWGAGVVVYLERGADLHIVQLMSLPLTVSCFSKIQIGFTFLAPAYPGSPAQRAIKRCVCVCVCVIYICMLTAMCEVIAWCCQMYCHYCYLMVQHVCCMQSWLAKHVCWLTIFPPTHSVLAYNSPVSQIPSTSFPL